MGIDILGGLNTLTQAATSGLNFYEAELTRQQNLELQKEQWAREDTAMQRRVKDLIAAGLNPVLAANGMGASSSLTTRLEAPQLGRVDLTGIYQAGLLKNQANIAQHDADIANEKSMQEEMHTQVLAKESELKNAINNYKLHALTGEGMPVTTRLAQNEILRSNNEQWEAENLARKAFADANTAETESKLRETELKLRELDYKNYYLNLAAGVAKNISGAVLQGATASKMLRTAQ